MTEIGQQILLFMWLLYTPQNNGVELKRAYYAEQSSCIIASYQLHNSSSCRLVEMKKE